MKGYAGVDCNDSTIIKHMMDFCYYITVGNLDEAFKVRFIYSKIISVNFFFIYHN